MGDGSIKDLAESKQALPPALSLLADPAISSQRAIRFILQFQRRWLLSECSRIKQAFALSETRLNNKLLPPRHLQSLKFRDPQIKRKTGKKHSFLINTQIEHSLVLCKVLMTPHPKGLRMSGYFPVFKILFFLT